MSNKKIENTSEKIWEEIKNLKLELFGLPNQFVHLRCKPVEIDPSRLFLKIDAGAVFSALETLLAPKYTVEMSNNFVIISKL